LFQEKTSPSPLSPSAGKLVINDESNAEQCIDTTDNYASEVVVNVDSSTIVVSSIGIYLH